MEGSDADKPLSATESVQAWLATMPLGDELERLRAELAVAKTRLAATAAEIPPLKSAIESANTAVAARQAEAARKQVAAEELRRRIDAGHADLRRLRAEVAAARHAKDATERRVLERRQAARALLLAERAVVAEAHALAWAAAAAEEQAARAQRTDHHDVVTLPARRLEELRGAAEAEEREVEARVDEAQARRRAAKARRAAAVARLDAARARKREADAELLRRRRVDGGEGGDGERGSSAVLARRRSGRSRFTVKKLRSYLCSSAARRA